MKTEFSAAVVQMTSVDDIDLNLQQIETLLAEIFKNQRPDLVCFPENCLYLRIVEGEKIQGIDLSHRAFCVLSLLAKKYKTAIHLGSVPLILEHKLYNSSVLITSDGKVTATYQKIHLFDIQLQGQAAIRESDAFAHGKSPNILNLDGWKIGESICYDLRFAELFSFYARNQVGIILVPAAFLVETGKAHWEILLRARAIENQCYILASAQGGLHKSIHMGERSTFGHSMVIDPWGKIIELTESEGPGYICASLSASKIDQVRAQIPMQSHRRL